MKEACKPAGSGRMGNFFWEILMVKQVNLMLGFKPEDVAALGLALRLALAIALPPVLMLFLGQYLGRIFGRDAIFIAVSVLVGLYIGFRQAIRLLLKK
jgi:uncharacterized membrane protein